MTSVQAKSNKHLRKTPLIEKTSDFRGINITVRHGLLSLPFNLAFCFNLQTARQSGAFEGRSRSGKLNTSGACGPELKCPRRDLVSALSLFPHL